jgi:FkbM family methyltransferase
VTAVEAFPPIFRHLCDNIKLNQLSNVIAYNIALGNSDEDVYFMSMKKICPVEKTNRLLNNTGGMHVFTQKDIDNNIRSANLADKSIKNRVVRLDDTPIDDFDILLVDIEGFEYDFLLGAEEKIKRNKPIIIIEIWNNQKRQRENMPQSQEDVANYIFSLGYSLVDYMGDDFVFEPLPPLTE